MKQGLARWGLTALAAALALLAALPSWLWRAQLPNPLATHWSLMGRPDGAMSVTAFAAYMAVMGVLGAGIMLVAGWGRGLERTVRAAFAGTGAFVAGLAAAIGVWVPAVQRGVHGWRAAPDLDLTGLVSMLGAPIALAMLAAGLGYAWPARDGGFVNDTRGLGLRGDEQAVWMRRMSVR